MNEANFFLVVGIQIFGVGGLPSGEGLITIQNQQGRAVQTVRLGGPGTNTAGTVTALQFEVRAQKLIGAYCRKFPIKVLFANTGQSLPDITDVDGV